MCPLVQMSSDGAGLGCEFQPRRRHPEERGHRLGLGGALPLPSPPCSRDQSFSPPPNPEKRPQQAPVVKEGAGPQDGQSSGSSITGQGQLPPASGWRGLSFQERQMGQGSKWAPAERGYLAGLPPPELPWLGDEGAARAGTAGSPGHQIRRPVCGVWASAALQAHGSQGHSGVLFSPLHSPRLPFFPNTAAVEL